MSLTEQNLQDLPTAPQNTKAVAGKDTLLYVALLQNPLTWLLVGGQKNSAMNQKADSLDGSDKSSGGWSNKVAGMKSWTIDYDGLFVLNDDGLEILNYAFRNGEKVYLRQEYSDGSYRLGWASITAYDDSHASDAISTIKVTFEGSGAISDIQYPASNATIATPTATHVAQATADATFAVTPTDCTIRALTQADGTQLVNQTDYTFVAGTLTLKASYLNALATGAHTLAAKFATGDIAITVNITAA